MSEVVITTKRMNLEQAQSSNLKLYHQHLLIENRVKCNLVLVKKSHL